MSGKDAGALVAVKEIRVTKEPIFDSHDLDEKTL